MTYHIFTALHPQTPANVRQQVLLKGFQSPDMLGLEAACGSAGGGGSQAGECARLHHLLPPGLPDQRGGEGCAPVGWAKTAHRHCTSHLDAASRAAAGRGVVLAHSAGWDFFSGLPVCCHLDGAWISHGKAREMCSVRSMRPLRSIFCCMLLGPVMPMKPNRLMTCEAPVCSHEHFACPITRRARGGPCLNIWASADAVVAAQATSALDAESEALVQDALDRVAVHRTVLVCPVLSMHHSCDHGTAWHTAMDACHLAYDADACAWGINAEQGLSRGVCSHERGHITAGDRLGVWEFEYCWPRG